MSEPTSTTTEAPAETLQRHLDRQGRLSQWISLEAFEWLRDSQSRQAANEEAENRWWRKKWTEGDTMPIGTAGESEEMRQTILGDITNPAPIIMAPPQPQQQSPWLPLALAAAAGVGTEGDWQAKRPQLINERSQTRDIRG
jgi:hypothetical protein